MSGGTMNHQRVVRNFMAIAWQALKGKSCSPVSSDFKIRVPLAGGDEAFYYPDAAIICVPVAGNAHFADSPSVILEGLSPSTRRNDEVQKYRDYITIPSLMTYILADSDRPFLTVHRRDGDTFRREVIADPGSSLDLPEVGISIPLKELYFEVS